MTKKAKKKTQKLNDRKIVIIVSAIVICLLIFMTVFWIKRGTYAIDDNIPTISLNCPTEAKPGSNIVCNVSLNMTSGDPILSVNANYDLAEKIKYVSFETDSECQENSCFETYADTQNGFAIVNLNGVTSNTLLGKITFEVLEDAQTDENYKIGLKNVELSNDKYEMIELAAVSKNVKVTNNEPIIITDSEIVKRIKNNTTYGELKTTLNLEGEITIISNDGNEIGDDDIVKTGDKIQLSNGSELILSVLGDLTGDGLIKVNDVSKLYRHLKERQIITDEYILAAGNVINDEEIKVNDVSRLYRYVKERITSLEVIE